MTTSPHVNGPWLQTALLLDHQALRQGDSQTLLMRLQQAVQLEPDIVLPHAVRLVVLLGWFVGDACGTSTVTLAAQDPLGQTRLQQSFSLELLGDSDTRLVVARRLTLDVDAPGIWWVDVSLGDQLVTRLPLRVRYPGETAVGYRHVPDGQRRADQG